MCRLRRQPNVDDAYPLSREFQRMLSMKLRLALALFLIALAVGDLPAQTLFLGLGPTYAIPQGSFEETNKESFGGSLVIGSRKYCQLWTGLRLGYTEYQRRTDTTSNYYTEAITLSPEARYFFAQPLDFPLYVHGMLTFSGISGTDSATRTGLGGGLGLGYLLFYDSNCCNWFLDLYANYHAPNLILRSDLRPSLSAIVVGVNLNFGL